MRADACCAANAEPIRTGDDKLHVDDPGYSFANKLDNTRIACAASAAVHLIYILLVLSHVRPYVK